MLNSQTFSGVKPPDPPVRRGEMGRGGDLGAGGKERGKRGVG